MLSFSTDQGVFSKEEVDFGSRTLVESFKEPEIEGEVLDLGCGYGPIGLSIAKDFPDRYVVLVDINERAVNLAKENANQNNIENVEVVESDRLRLIRDKRFASILTNPPVRAGKKIVHAMLEESYEALLPKGELWVVLQKKQGAPSAQKKLNEICPEVDIITRNKGYYIIKAKKV